VYVAVLAGVVVGGQLAVHFLQLLPQSPVLSQFRLQLLSLGPLFANLGVQFVLLLVKGGHHDLSDLAGLAQKLVFG
jgi:hypothetical protein